MTLRFFAGLGALLPSKSGFGLFSAVDVRAREPIAALISPSFSACARSFVMGTPDGAVSGSLAFASSHDERSKYL